LDGVMREIRDLIGSESVYLTIDLDVLDPAFAPAVATPEPSGLSTAEILKIVRKIAEMKLVGVDVVELVPQYDNGNTAFVAARIIYEILAVLGSKK
ncbi:MAG: arginase family protein, partial [Candidatus Hadarchaeales archaeon]